MDGTLTTFIVYFAALLAVGLYFYRRSESIEDYLLGGRGMGAWVTALSAQASDMSGWLLMGLPGAVYLAGGGEVWIAVGLFIGTVCNWLLVSARLRIYTEQTRAITLPSFFEERFRDPTGLLRTLSALFILVFFTIYATSGLVAAGKLFNGVFDVDYHLAVLIGGGVIILYTFLGGFLAVCWTDLFQGSLMVVAILVVPAIAYFHTGGLDAVRENMAARDLAAGLIPQTRWPALAIASAAAWGLGYFGQPHILARFMSVRSLHKLRESMVIAILWVAVSLAGAVAIGYIGIGMFESMPSGDPERVFIHMIERLFNPWLGGVMLAAILSAIMSTIDSQLLVSSSALSEDFYQKVIKRQASDREVVWVGRLCVILMSAVALVLAMDQDSRILDIVAYAWGGFGAAFGPLVLFALFSRRTTWQAALAGLVVGTVVLVVWQQTQVYDSRLDAWRSLGDYMYGILPGFAANAATIWIVNRFLKQSDPAVLAEFDQVKERIHAK